MRHHPHLRLVQNDASLLLIAAAAGAEKAAELDGELLSCCAEAEAADREAGAAMDRIEAMNPDAPSTAVALADAVPLFDAYADAVRRAAQLRAKVASAVVVGIWFS